MVLDGLLTARKAPRRGCFAHYADLRIMPTCGANPAWEAVIVVKEAA